MKLFKATITALLGLAIAMPTRERRCCHNQCRSNQRTRHFARWYVNICTLGNAQQAR